jgi:hypothetical protein
VSIKVCKPNTNTHFSTLVESTELIKHIDNISSA